MMRLPTALACSLLALLPTSTAHAASQTFNTALPVAEGEFIVREQFFFFKAGEEDELTPADREVTVRGGLTVLGYGVNGRLAIFGVVPYLNKELRVTTLGGERLTRRTNGVGDARVFGRYTLFRADAPGRTFRVAPFEYVTRRWVLEGILQVPLHNISTGWLSRMT